MKRIRTLSTILGLLLGLAWFVGLRPTFLGGHTTYIVVSGHSMEPLLHTGDLAVVRRQPAYQRGQVILYQADGGKVIHRIIGGTAARGFITQGINRTDPDIWRPTPSQVYGTMWLHVPKVGLWLGAFRTPAGLAALCAGLTALSLFSSPPARRSPKKEVVPC